MVHIKKKKKYRIHVDLQNNCQDSIEDSYIL